MLIIGCDYHPSFQQIAFVDTETGELRDETMLFGYYGDGCARSSLNNFIPV